MMEQESSGKRYVLQQDIYIPRWVTQEVQAKAIAATHTQMGFTEEEEVYIKIIDKFRVTYLQ